MQIDRDGTNDSESETSILSKPEDEVHIELFMEIINLLTDLLY